jgi:hypothetical protein
MRHAITKGIADRVLIGQEPIRRNLRSAEDALAKITNERVGVVAVALAVALADDASAGRIWPP